MELGIWAIKSIEIRSPRMMTKKNPCEFHLKRAILRSTEIDLRLLLSTSIRNHECLDSWRSDNVDLADFALIMSDQAIQHVANHRYQLQ
jgi:hypothetical protein